MSRSSVFDERATALYLPPLGPGSSFEAFQEVVAALRAPDGCPWDREQTVAALQHFLLEECYEVLEALAGADPRAVAGELGDLLFQIVFLARLYEERGDFTLDEL